VIAAAIVPAAGRGERLGPGGPKALRELAGLPLLVHAVRALGAARAVAEVVVVAPGDAVDEVRALMRGDTVLQSEDVRVLVVAGGRTRQESVRLGLAALGDDVDVVLVHDAARPLVPVDLVDRVVQAVRTGADAVIPVLPLADTVKRVDEAGRVDATIDRSTLRAVQTPQGFARAVLEEAHHAASTDADDEATAATDDAGLVERLGTTVHAVPGAEEAFKVTRPIDLLLAEAVLSRRRAGGARDGR
jgi:2-C-methyl-D-erythritol 4-phosphate cytidylyltransferase